MRHTFWRKLCGGRRVPLPLCLLAATVLLAATRTNIDGWHRTPGQGGVAERVFFPSNNNAAPRCFLLDNEVAHPVQSTEFMQGFAEIQDAIDQSLLGGKRLHPYGSLLPTSNVIFDEENMLESCGLNYVKLGFAEDQVVDAIKKGRLPFVQSSVRMVGWYHARRIGVGRTWRRKLKGLVYDCWERRKDERKKKKTKPKLLSV